LIFIHIGHRIASETGVQSKEMASSDSSGSSSPVLVDAKSDFVEKSSSVDAIGEFPDLQPTLSRRVTSSRALEQRMDDITTKDAGDGMTTSTAVRNHDPISLI
jgi:hypothetical protein